MIATRVIWTYHMEERALATDGLRATTKLTPKAYGSLLPSVSPLGSRFDEQPSGLVVIDLGDLLAGQRDRPEPVGNTTGWRRRLG